MITGSSQHRPGRRVIAVRLAVGALLGSLGLIAAGCGGSASPSVANIATTPTSTSPTAQGPSSAASTASGVAFADCMRSHGVPNFPVPGAGGTVGSTSAINPASPQVQAASRDCASKLPPISPALVAQARTQMLKMSACMRSHGVPNFPDPEIKVSAGGIQAKISASSSSGGSLNPDSPVFQAAMKTCAPDLPGADNGKAPAGGLHSGQGPVAIRTQQVSG